MAETIAPAPAEGWSEPPRGHKKPTQERPIRAWAGLAPGRSALAPLRPNVGAVQTGTYARSRPLWRARVTPTASLVNDTLTRWNRIDVWVNNAGSTLVAQLERRRARLSLRVFPDGDARMHLTQSLSAMRTHRPGQIFPPHGSVGARGLRTPLHD